VIEEREGPAKAKDQRQGNWEQEDSLDDRFALNMGVVETRYSSVSSVQGE